MITRLEADDDKRTASVRQRTLMRQRDMTRVGS